MLSQIISQPPPGANINRTPDAKIVTVNMTGGGSNVYMCPPTTPTPITSQSAMGTTPAFEIVTITDVFPVPDVRTGLSLSSDENNPYRPDRLARLQP